MFQIYAAAKKQQQAITRQKRMSSIYNGGTTSGRRETTDANGGGNTNEGMSPSPFNSKARRLTNTSFNLPHMEEPPYENNKEDQTLSENWFVVLLYIKQDTQLSPGYFPPSNFDFKKCVYRKNYPFICVLNHFC